MPVSLLELRAKNFRSLKDVRIGPLGPVSVLVGPNASGKTNLLRVIAFLGDLVRRDLAGAIELHGGWSRLRFRDGTNAPIVISVKALITRHARESAPDEYELRFAQRPTVLGPRRALLSRRETFTFKRVKGRGRRISIKGGSVQVSDSSRAAAPRQLTLNTQSAGLSTLPRLGAAEGGDEVQKLAALFETFRVFDVDVEAARRPGELRRATRLAHDASNLADFLAYLHDSEPEQFERLQRDAITMAPGLQEIVLSELPGPTVGVAVGLRERGLKDLTSLADASFGTVRALALLAMLYDPAPPRLTCMEEIDHGLHPHVFDRVVELVREASSKTQFLIATHSPAFVNRLRSEELIVCERDEGTGASCIPAIDPGRVRELEERAGGRLGLGELWFSGSLGGVP